MPHHWSDKFVCMYQIDSIYIASLQIHYYSEALPTAWILCRSFTPKCHRQLRVKDLPKVPTWRLEWDSNQRHFGRKATNLPIIHHAPLRPSHLQIPGGPKMARVALSRRAIDGPRVSELQ